jgi:plastocyanin
MRSSALRCGVLFAGIGYSAVLASCFSDRPTNIIDPPDDADCSIRLSSPAIGTVGAIVAMNDFRFQPQELRVPRGTRVTWVYCEPPGIDPHTTTSDTGLWDAEFTSSVDSFSRVFDQAGRFEYHCIPHASFMRGVVIVE